MFHIGQGLGATAGPSFWRPLARGTVSQHQAGDPACKLKAPGRCTDMCAPPIRPKYAEAQPGDPTRSACLYIAASVRKSAISSSEAVRLMLIPRECVSATVEHDTVHHARSAHPREISSDPGSRPAIGVAGSSAPGIAALLGSVTRCIAARPTGRYVLSLAQCWGGVWRR